MTGAALAVVYVLALVLICSAIAILQKRHLLNKRPLPSTARQAGLAAMEIFQTPDQRQAINEIEFKNNDWKEEPKAARGTRRIPSGRQG